ncbi:MAG: TetR/AcrR family transcriptional regulator [Pelagimonas sp.]|jgi:AcrR family transcriptional regulator|nr:TetR/AcrR family transcriptional regulator [Pelagimonas sp.]
MGAEPLVRKGRKFDQVLKGAHEIFMRDGFEGASVDDIARHSGVSKATLYSYFSDKRLLFMEVAMNQCVAQAEQSLMNIDTSRPARQVLTDLGHQLLEFMTSDLGLQIFKVFLAEAERFPDIGKKFYQSGPMVTHNAIVAYFEEAQARGELSIEDKHIASDQFITLCKADIWLKVVFGIQTSFSEQEKSYVVDNAVATFLARFGSEPI